MGGYDFGYAGSPHNTKRFGELLHLQRVVICSEGHVICQIGVLDAGGMSFEQRKRVSIGVELAANPSILFLDEPTTG